MINRKPAKNPSLRYKKNTRGQSRQAYFYVNVNHLAVYKAVYVWTGELVSSVNTVISLQFVYVNLPPINGKYTVQRRQDLHFVLLLDSLWVCGRSQGGRTRHDFSRAWLEAVRHCSGSGHGPTQNEPVKKCCANCVLLYFPSTEFKSAFNVYWHGGGAAGLSCTELSIWEFPFFDGGLLAGVD